MRCFPSCVYRNKSRRSSLPLFTQPIMKGMQLDLLLFTKSFHSQTAGLLPLNQPIHSFLLCHHFIFDKIKNQLPAQQYAVGERDTNIIMVNENESGERASSCRMPTGQSKPDHIMFQVLFLIKRMTDLPIYIYQDII